MTDDEIKEAIEELNLLAAAVEQHVFSQIPELSYTGLLEVAKVVVPSDAYVDKFEHVLNKVKREVILIRKR